MDTKRPNLYFSRHGIHLNLKMKEEALKWVLGLLVVGVILFVLFYPGQLYAQTKDAVFNFVYRNMPEKRAPQISVRSEVPAEFEKYFDTLVLKMKNPGSRENCRVEIGQMPNAKGFSIAFKSDKVQIAKISERGLSPSEKTETIAGLKPCTVKGEKFNAFYRCLVNGKLCSDTYEEGDFSIDKSSSIAPFLFRFDTSHMCVVYTEVSGGSFGCSYDCLRQMQIVYPDCSKPT